MPWQTKFLRLMAGPGTGKTYQMMEAVADLLRSNVNPRRILAVTFTRVAAASLVKELASLDVPGCDNIRAGTLHSFCFSLLSKAEVFEHLDRIARPLITFKKRGGTLAFEAEPLLVDLDNQPRFGGKRDRTKRVRQFDAAWARLQSDTPGWPHNAVDREFQRVLHAWLRFHQSMLIGELVPEALRYLRDNPACRELTAFDYVIVDEYQDLNKADQALIDLLTAEASGFVIGDEDQSIYSFRYAHPEGILEFAETHAETHDETLDRCRRCPKQVVEMANHLIQHNHPDLHAPRLRPRLANPNGEVHIVQWESLTEEAAGIARFVKHLIDQRDYRPRDVLILCPRRLMGYGLRDALTEQDILTHSFYHEEALEPEVAQAAFSLLTLLANRDDRVALRFWVGFGSPSWRSGEYAKLRGHCEQTGLSPWQALEQIAEGTLSLPGTRGISQRFSILLDELTTLDGLGLVEVVDHVFPEGVEWAKPLREGSSVAIDTEDVENLNALWLLDTLRTQITQPELPESGDYVRIMSLHKSKGLTSKAVIVAGCIHGLIPFYDRDETPAEKNKTLEEQRRLFYVACTRTREILVLSSVINLERQLAYRIGATVRGGGGAVGSTISSPFIAELGPRAPHPVRGPIWRRNDYA